MMVRNGNGNLRVALTVVSALCGLHIGCIDRPAAKLPEVTQSGVTATVMNNSINKVDLLMMVDNSNSMRDNQANIMLQLGLMINTLVSPPCVNPADMTPHTCDATNTADVPQYPPVADLHVGVVDSDLGTPGSSVPGCADTDVGDDGLLNPIRNGQALMHHEPFTGLPASFMRPAICTGAGTDPNQFPAFIAFESATDPNCVEPACSDNDAVQFTTNFQCNAGLYINGCGLEQQLEAVWRALIYHHPDSNPANMGDPNFGFMRDDALLALVFLTDEEDGSVRNCQYATPADMPCIDALDVFNAASTAWSSSNLNLRDYMYQPGGPQDPTWNLDRYIAPGDPTRGYLSLKPDHPERVLFAAITGIPLAADLAETPDSTEPTGSHANWDQLLGPAGGNGADDFVNRNSAMAFSSMSSEGPISMAMANADPACPERTVPSCRRDGTTYDPTFCTTDQQYFAWPSRRIVEVARRFDQSPLCNGQPCHNGLVASICSTDYSGAMRAIVQKIQSRLTAACLPRMLMQQPDANGNLVVQCTVIETLAASPTAGMGSCPAGLSDPPDATNMNMPTVTVTTDAQGNMHRVCAVPEVPISATTNMPVAGMEGWYYDTSTNTGGASGCTQRISFTGMATPPSGSSVQLECIQSETGGDAGNDAAAAPTG